MRVVALIPAAGRGRRMGGEKPKAFLPLGGIPILSHTLQKFEACLQVDEILPLVPEEEIFFCAEKIVRPLGLKKISNILPGGPERQDSVYRGLQAVAKDTDFVIIHDGVRPFVPEKLIQQGLRETQKSGAVVVALPVGDTLKEVSEDRRVMGTVDRSPLWCIQTPQFFEYGLILQAHEMARKDGFYGTDDAALVERLGISVMVIEGTRTNLKITTPEDLLLGEALLRYLKDFDSPIH